MAGQESARRSLRRWPERTFADVAVLLGRGFDEIEQVATDFFADCQRVAYRFHVRISTPSAAIEFSEYRSRYSPKVDAMRKSPNEQFVHVGVDALCVYRVEP